MYPGGDAIGSGGDIGAPFGCGTDAKLDAEATMIRWAALRRTDGVAKEEERRGSGSFSETRDAGGDVDGRVGSSRNGLSGVRGCDDHGSGILVIDAYLSGPEKLGSLPVRAELRRCLPLKTAS